jgi:hypothetical protein
MFLAAHTWNSGIQWCLNCPQCYGGVHCAMLSSMKKTLLCKNHHSAWLAEVNFDYAVTTQKWGALFGSQIV